MSIKLSLKQTAFIDQLFINGFNATQAYKTAYPLAKTGHDAHGARLIVNGKVKAEIDRRRAVQVKEHALTLEWLRAEHIAEYNRLKNTDKTNARQHLEAAGKTIAAYIDRHRDETTDQPQPLTESETEQLKAMAEHATRLRQQEAPMERRRSFEATEDDIFN